MERASPDVADGLVRYASGLSCKMSGDRALPTQTDQHGTRHREFEDPPVVESVLGVQFEPLPGWSIPHFGLFWETIRDRFPTFEDQVPLPHEMESFGKPTRLLGRLELLNRPVARCWFKAAEEGLLLQVQNDRFIQNWRKEKGQVETYPQYERTRESYRHDWEGFRSFLKEWGLGEPLIEQCEMSYVNHLESGKGWESLKEVGTIFSPLSTLPREELPDVEAFLLDVRYLLPGERGRLYVQLQPAIRNTDGKEILLFTLMARGRPSSSATEDVFDWFEMARDWIHKAFDVYPSEKIRRVWRERESK